MKARLAPVYFEEGINRQEFDGQLGTLTSLLADEAEFLPPIALGAPVPAEADAVVFPQLVGEAYRQLQRFKEIQVPVLVVTSEFGTMAMWDWEIVTFLRAEGIDVFAPYRLEQTRTLCRALGFKRDMRRTKFLVFQDNPGEGMQASIFKRFFWWEDECVQRIQDAFGISVVKKSFKQLGAEAKRISDAEAEEVLRQWEIPAEGVTARAMNSAVKLYAAVKRELDLDDRIRGVGINCLNESFHSDTTPCLAWSMLYEERGIMWACEGDILSLLTKYILHNTLQAPVMMSNLYPFLMGMTALKHEKIPSFPDVAEPENHLLVGHCGFFGLMPKSFAADWKLKPKVLGIVDDNATAVDARYSLGDLTIAQFHPTLTKMIAVKGDLIDYAGYPGSDCRNGGVIRVGDGHKLMSSLYSHHGCFIPGRKEDELVLVSRILGMGLEKV